jgi:hypothetical protein
MGMGQRWHGLSFKEWRSEKTVKHQSEQHQ